MSRSLFIFVSFTVFNQFGVNGFLPIQQMSSAYSRETISAATGDIIELDDSNFRKLFSGDKPVLIDACAPW
jgi:hypothetical protein